MDLFVDLDHGSTVPLYRQLQSTLLELIVSGRLPHGGKLPSSRSLSGQLRISRNTVNLCYQELVASGLVRATERHGYYVHVPAASSATDDSAQDESFDWQRRLIVPGGHDLPEIDKPADWFDAPYPFIAGQVEHDRFPARAWERSLREALHKPHLHHSIRDDLVGDDPLLVRQIIDRILPGRGVFADESQVMITLGSQQGLAMLATLLLDPTRAILMEDPGYLDARHIFQRSGARVLPLPVDEDGPIVPETTAGVDVVYTTPSHHNPTNVTMSLDRRHALLQRASHAGTVVIEDDYDSEFRYHGAPSPSLKSLDTCGNVVYLGTFSKFLSPGLRLGFMVGSPELIAAAKKERRYTVRHAPGQIQRAMALFIQSGDYHRTLRMTRDRMSRKYDLITEAAAAHLPLENFSFPPGGVSLWADAGPDIPVDRLLPAAAAQGIIIERGDIFFFRPPATHHIRIGFGAIAESRIVPGIRKLGQVFGSLR